MNIQRVQATIFRVIGVFFDSDIWLRFPGSFWCVTCCPSIALQMSEQGPKQSVARKGVFEVLTYVWEYQTYVDALRTDSDNLKARLSKVQREVEDARSNRQDIKQQVVKWLEDCNKELKIAETLLGSLRPEASCWKFTCSCDCKHRYTVAARAESHSKEVKILMERCSFEGGVSLELKSLPLMPPPLTPTMQSAYKAVPSREKYLERIMEALLGSDKCVIGLYGANDVGKTTLVRRLAVAIDSGSVFNGVTIGEGDWGDALVGQMQLEMAQQIGLIMTFESLDKAKMLNNKLTSMGKVAIIIDNVEKRLDLNKIGIPWPDGTNGCRIVVVSKSLDMCKEMKTQMNLEIEPLCQEEALHLFDELTKEYNLTDTAKIQQARADILSKFLWTPGEIEMLIDTFHSKLLLPANSIVSIDGIGKKTLTLGAEALEFIFAKNPIKCRWLTASSSISSLKVAELFLHWSLKIEEVREEWLSPATNYGAYFIYQLNPRARGFNTTPVSITVGNISKTCYLDPLTAASKTLEGGGAMPKRRKDGWLEIELGIFFNVGHSGAVIGLLVKETTTTKSGLLVQGFQLRPLD